MLFKFTDRARIVLQLATEEARRYRHAFVGPGHLLLALIREGSGVAAVALHNLGVELRQVRLNVVRIILPEPTSVGAGRLPQTPHAKKVIEFAIEEARLLHHDYVGTEHLLLGLLHDEEDVAAQVLLNLDVQLHQVRDEVMNLIGFPTGERPPETAIQSDEPKHWKPIAQESALSELPRNFEHVPRAIATAFERQIDVVKQEKEAAIAAHSFERASELFEFERKLRRLRDEFMSHWPQDP